MDVLPGAELVDAVLDRREVLLDESSLREDVTLGAANGVLRILHAHRQPDDRLGSILQLLLELLGNPPHLLARGLAVGPRAPDLLGGLQLPGVHALVDLLEEAALLSQLPEAPRVIGRVVADLLQA